MKHPFRVFFASLLAVFAGLPIPLPAQSPVEYKISFPNADHHEAEIEITFPDLPDRPLEVRMSRTSPGRYALHEFAKNVYNFRAFDGQGQPLDAARPNPHQWDVSGHGGTVRIRYTLFGNRCDGTYAAIDNTHAHLNLPATFMWARGLEERPVGLKIEPPDPDWRVATQLAPSEDPNIFSAPDLAYFLDSPIEVSDFLLHQWTVEHRGKSYAIRLALHHQGTDEQAEAFAQMVERVVAEQIALFREPPEFDFGSYTFLADYLPQASGDGMEHRNSTVMSSSRSLQDRAVRNLFTVSHEFFHAWNTERIRPRSLQPFDFEEANMSGELWLAEGFTSYYDDLFLHRAGILSLDRYAQGLSGLGFILNAPGRQFGSPVEMSRLAPFFDGARWADPVNRSNTFLSYYGYGSAVAMALDLTLRSRFDSVSLDDFMRALWKEFGKTEKGYDNAALESVLAKVTGDAEFARDFFARSVYGRELPDFEPLLAAAGFELRKAEEGQAWLGRPDLQYKEGKATVRSSIKGSPLYQAGLDSGDVLLSVGEQSIRSAEDWDQLIEGHDPGDSVEIEFEKNGEKRTVEVTLQENPRLEVVPFEHASREVRPEIQAFRQSWLGSLAPQSGPRLFRHCPVCKRSYPFRYDYCRYDGEELKITPEAEN